MPCECPLSSALGRAAIQATRPRAGAFCTVTHLFLLDRRASCCLRNRSSLALRVLVRRPDTDLHFADTALIAGSTILEVRTHALPVFRINERITVDGIDHVIQAGRCRDPDRLVWPLEVRPLTPEEPPPPVEPVPERFVQGLWDGSYAVLPDVAVAVGQLVYLTPAGFLALSRADADATAVVAGVVVAGAAAGHPAQWTVNHPVDRSDWAPLTDDGAATLVPGATYYLSAVQAGGITRTPPERPGQWVLPVGVAVTPTALHIAPGVSCKL